MLSTDYHEAPPAGVAPPVKRSAASLVGRLAQFFRAHPNQWIDGRTLGTIAGGYAWRTRVSDLRRAPFFFSIENRQRRFEAAPGRFITVSEYRYQAASGDGHEGGA